ncbi:nitroreductase family protein [Pseudoalteromonas marina]|uniref:nitroreductase family protein n=1 Tax=Pseudoalteromonas marina TaxID=267375 RepID=UPI002734C2E6|nr:nitroreductase family protein [Pseudoalteromonas marina]MDP2485781.1 nitroreductase family protein [Pseudoalteromonas marina]
MKKLIKSLFPIFLYNFIRSIIRYIRLSKSYLYDLNHYFNNSMDLDDYSEGKLISRIILDTHVIEKGLTMPETKLGFGKARLKILMDNIKFFVLNFNTVNPQLLHGFSVIEEYFKFHENVGFELEPKIVSEYLNLQDLKKAKSFDHFQRNQVEIKKLDYFSSIKAPFALFSESRSSIRNYSEEYVSNDALNSVLDLARNTPSACNRQAVRLHLYRDTDDIADILKVQGGNRGFGHLANFLIAITFKSSVYFEENERNSGFVDGGMYGMNILYALHAESIAACILNAAHTPEKDLKMRRVAKVPNDETFVAFIAGGIPPESFKIARSYRYPLDFILTKH